MRRWCVFKPMVKGGITNASDRALHRVWRGGNTLFENGYHRIVDLGRLDMPARAGLWKGSFDWWTTKKNRANTDAVRLYAFVFLYGKRWPYHPDDTTKIPLLARLCKYNYAPKSTWKGIKMHKRGRPVLFQFFSGPAKRVVYQLLGTGA